MKLFNVYKAEVEIQTKDEALELSMDERFPGQLTLLLSPSGISITMRTRELELALDGLTKRLESGALRG